MDLIFKYKQEKKDRKGTGNSNCSIYLFSGSTQLEYSAVFNLDYQRYGSRKHVTFEHVFNLNLDNGDISTSYKIINDGLTDDKMFRNCNLNKKNDFKLFFDLTENGFLRGEKRNGFWGVKYYRQCDIMISKITEIFKPLYINQYYNSKNYINKSTINSLFDLIVDFHLDKKNIKAHDNVYHDIQYDYPKKKFLEINENKFLPSILDSYKIKSKYLISELNKNSERPILIRSLNYLCKLFGSNYVEYLRQINWSTHCFDLPNNKKIHSLKNESEKNFMVSVINKWENSGLKSDSLIYSINKLLSIRDLIEEKGVDLKFKARNDNEFDDLMETWSNMKLHMTRGFKLKYDLPSEFLNDIQSDIILNNETFKVKVLTSEEDFRIEGFLMKNCMSKQFLHGSIYIYIAIQNKKKRINLQYRKGRLVQCYGKANTSVSNNFDGAIEILNNKFTKYKDIQWKKEKYDYIIN